jgi:predicted transporter
MKPMHLVGLMLWRGGFLLAAAVAAYEIARIVLAFLDLPEALKLGGGLALSGLFLVLASLMLENRQDARA